MGTKQRRKIARHQRDLLRLAEEHLLVRKQALKYATENRMLRERLDAIETSTVTHNNYLSEVLKCALQTTYGESVTRCFSTRQVGTLPHRVPMMSPHEMVEMAMRNLPPHQAADVLVYYAEEITATIRPTAGVLHFQCGNLCRSFAVPQMMLAGMPEDLALAEISRAIAPEILKYIRSSQ